MTSSVLRRIRIVVAAVVFACMFLIFTDLRHVIPDLYVTRLMFFQFVPSMLKFIALASVSGIGFILILILTLITGRTYCSFLCPLGIGQDILSRFGGRIKRKFRRYGFRKPHTILRYSLLAITGAVSFLWGIYLLTLLDPFSIFSRLMTFFARPVVVVLNNIAAHILGKIDIYTISSMPHQGFSVLAWALPFAFFLLIGIQSLIKGRLYCNMFCPLGTLLGLISRISFFRIKFNESACTRCGRCAIGCKSSCIDFLKYDIDVTRCVGCFDCIHICQESALEYRNVLFVKEKPETDERKRKFVVSSLLLLLGLSGSLKGVEKSVPRPGKVSIVKEPRSFPVAPPGAGSIAELNKWCTACSLCINICPNGVLQPALNQYGLDGFMQPVMNYRKNFCNYNCTACTEICPTGALKPLLPEAKKLTQLGRAVFIKDNCIVKTEKTACGACSERCPTKAVHLVQYEGHLLIPELSTETCIGCGHCEYACPTTPYKAIFVDGNEIHKAAKKPENKESDIKTPVDFPF
jgi:ferredoxin